MRIINVPMRKILALPFPTPLSRRLMLVTLTGRRSGRTYRQPLSYVRSGSTLLTPGGGNWKHNLQAGRAETIRIGGRDITAEPEIVRDLDELDGLLSVMAAKSPSATRFIPIPRDASGHFDREKLDAAVRHGFRIIRWHPADGTQT
jgi:hypothetical protein